MKERYKVFARGAEVQGLIEGRIDPEAYASVQRWIAQCYSMPSRAALIMEALNEVLGGCGVEAIRGRWVDGYHCDIQAVYVNMGDTYDTTVLLDHETGQYHVTCWGDWVERNERKRELV